MTRSEPAVDGPGDVFLCSLLILGLDFVLAPPPVLRWMASNVSVETDAGGNIKPSKKRSTERIDGIVACVMALGRAVLGGGKQRSVYETRGILQL